MATASDGRRYMRVPVGTGMFNAPKPQPYSKETKDFLNLVMEESRLTMLQRRALNAALKSGGPLPVHPPVAHGRNRAPVVTPPPEDVVHVPPRHRRSKEAILRSGAYERDRYVPKLDAVDSTKEKHSLQDKMAYGKEMPASPKHKTRRQPIIYDEPEIDRFEELVREVEDRIMFLKDMAKLGQERKYKQTINQEIAAKLREMKAVDKQRCEEFKNLLSLNT